MDKIDELKERLANEYACHDNVYPDSGEFNYRKRHFKPGFDAAMELQLPVLFLRWQTNEKYVYDLKKDKYVAAWNNYKEYTADELYEVFKHEQDCGLSLYKIMTNECAGCGRHVNHCVCP